jgi:SAM-dependent methyltransferase
MTNAEYVYGQNVDDAERERLSHLEDFLDTYTARRLDQIGIASGWRSLEVGAGHGSVARMLASRVGPSGAVVATDVDLRFLTELPSNVEVRRHDIETSDLGQALYDFIHCRAVLMWLREPGKALQRMISALKPGGWLLAEELDWGFCTLGQHLDALWATEYMHNLFRRHEAAGIRHPYFGRTLPALVAAAGFDNLGGDLAGAVATEGHSALEVIRLTVRALRAPSAALGESAVDLDRLGAVLASPRVIVVGITSVGVTARKPE